MEEKVADIVIEQRIRDGLISYLEMACSEIDLLDYQRNAPVDILGELINQFEDWFDVEHVKDGWYKEPTYTQEEIEAILRFSKIWDMLTEMPEHIDTIGDFLSSKYWPPFQSEAKRARSVLMKRGYLTEEAQELNKRLWRQPQ